MPSIDLLDALAFFFVINIVALSPDHHVILTLLMSAILCMKDLLILIWIIMLSVFGIDIARRFLLFLSLVHHGILSGKAGNLGRLLWLDVSLRSTSLPGLASTRLSRGRG